MELGIGGGPHRIRIWNKRFCIMKKLFILLSALLTGAISLSSILGHQAVDAEMNMQ
jgi:hypothetical protein